ncbi:MULTISPECIES: hypothetical protein [unclassified Mesorhizobium]|uniref:hypothetical protein n=1 Tax=unclassified Mesorhizobium TaxID=325217 RepID=UPI002414F09F|nr:MULTISPECIES: hypothetical protein [unclassified Mesorhizobium]MDG4902932.1 hypothetical protein [Mesorhizobium sp. WSM4962]MDG4906324.1 hypothetical protein [Mesorhizobium sp. WSM4898]MDG4920249.1 hypothetical protein [Mesorhizobium sp. WSM4989]
MTDLDKLRLLYVHFGIEPTADGFIGLLTALLVKPEQGFRPHKRHRSGRPRDYGKDIALILDADRVITERQCSDRAAVRILVTSRRFNHWNDENRRTLEDRLYGARRDEELTLLVQKARKEARARGVGLYVVGHEGSITVEAQQIPTEDPRVQAQPPKRSDPQSEDELTAEECEVLAAARAMFQADGEISKRERDAMSLARSHLTKAYRRQSPR